VNVNVKRNDTSVDVNFSPNFAMATLRYSGPLPLVIGGGYTQQR